MASFKNVDEFVKISRDLKGLGSRLPIKDNFKFELFIDYLDTVADVLKDRSSETGGNYDDSDLENIYPSPIDQIISDRNMKEMRRWLREIKNMTVSGDKSNEFKAVIFSFFIWHMAVKSLYFPIFFVAQGHFNIIGDLDYTLLNMKKGDLNTLRLVLDIRDTDIKRFMSRGSVSDEDLEYLRKYLRRLLDTQVQMEYGSFN